MTQAAATSSNERRALLLRMFDAAVQSAQASHCIAQHLPDPTTLGGGRLVVIGAGKASAAMAQALESHWRGPALQGLVVTRYGYAVPCKYIEIVEAAHPVPDEAGHAAAQRMLAMVQGLSAEDTVICLISGGGSSLLALPLDGISLEDKKAVNRALLKSGATINEMNCVRRHLSGIKGGRLAAACSPAKVITLVISDVPGDDPINIASGPTVGDPTTKEDALEVIRRYKLDLPLSVIQALASESAESVKPQDPRLLNSQLRIIATPQMALEAAAQVAKRSGYTPYILGDALEGEARDLGKALAGIAIQIARKSQPFEAPCVLLSGGETTVTLRGDGRGGRNVEFLLSLALTLDGQAGVSALAADTDGVDGQEEIAGAIIDEQTLARARAKGLHPPQELDNNNGHGFFQALGDSVVCGPTLTNVNDFRVILIDRV